MRGALGLRLVFSLLENSLKQLVLLLLRVVLIIIVVLVVSAECYLCLGPLHYLVRVLPISQLLLPRVVVVLGRHLLVDNLVIDRLLTMTARDTPSLTGALLPRAERGHSRVPRVVHDALLGDQAFWVVEVEAPLGEKRHKAFFRLLLLLHFI